MARREYKMTEEQYERLMDACKPVPYIVVGGVPPLSQQERANAAWQALGDELGFHYLSVRPVHGKSDRFFTAEDTTNDDSP